MKWTIYIGGWRKEEWLEWCIEVDHLYWWVGESGVVCYCGTSILLGVGRGSGVLKWTIYIGGWRKGEWCIEVDHLYWWVEEGGVVY